MGLARRQSRSPRLVGHFPLLPSGRHFSAAYCCESSKVPTPSPEKYFHRPFDLTDRLSTSHCTMATPAAAFHNAALAKRRKVGATEAAVSRTPGRSEGAAGGAVGGAVVAAARGEQPLPRAGTPARSIRAGRYGGRSSPAHLGPRRRGSRPPTGTARTYKRPGAAREGRRAECNTPSRPHTHRPRAASGSASVADAGVAAPCTRACLQWTQKRNVETDRQNMRSSGQGR